MIRVRQRILFAALGLFLAVTMGWGYLPTGAKPQAETVEIQPQGAPKLELRVGDHISIIGNTLADRMQHDGWLETYLHSRFPKHNLVFRNLGFSADELTIRLRSANFGTPDHWLNHTKADVIFAFFGYNESYQGDAGLERFKKDLDDFTKRTLAQKYNGKSAPRLVLFSPIGHENLKNNNLPDGRDNNRRIVLYTMAMEEVAKANQVPFVDLYRPSFTLYQSAEKPLTINGVHLTTEGNKALARLIDKSLFGEVPARNVNELEKIRQAVLETNFYWFNRYRTVDGYSIYGGRADLRFVGGQTNRVVMDREMEILDRMTANRDQKVWAVAQGREFKVDDSNLPPFIDVKTNKPGPLPGGKHLFLSGEEEIKSMKIAKGFKVNLFASEKEFPELTNAVQMSWDTKGRLWVAVWPTYPHWKPGEPMNDKLLIFEDTKGTGKADKMTVFADGLHCPTGFEFWNGGVLIAQAPDLMFLKDSKGGDKCDTRLRVLSGLDSADTHHTSNSFVLDPGGALYFQEGTFHHTQVETPWGPPQRCANAGVFRYEPRAQKFDVYVAYGFANPHGHVFDRWGRDIVVDGTGAVPYDAALFSGHLPYPLRHAGPPTVYRQPTRPCPGMEILSSRHFPEEMQGNLLVANVIGDQGIFRVKLDDKGASFAGTVEDWIVKSTDPKFRPSDLRVGPDGAIYFTDWHNPIVGHMQHNLRDPSRDREHGRIYRITYEGRELLKAPKIAGEPVEKLLDLLKEPEDRVRYRARIELGSRDSFTVLTAAKKWLAAQVAQEKTSGKNQRDVKEEGSLSFPAERMTWAKVFEWLIDQTKMPVHVAFVTKYGSLTTSEFILPKGKHTLPEAVDIINDILLLQGYVMIRTKSSFIVVREGEGRLTTDWVQRVTVENLNYHRRTEIVRIFVNFERGDAEKLIPEIKKNMSPFGDVVLVDAQHLILQDTVASLKRILAEFPPAPETEIEHHKMEILWLHQNHNVVNVDLLKEMLRSPDFRARAAATRVLCYWRDRVPEVLELLKKQAADAHPRVRLEAVRAASFFQTAEAVEIVLISAEHATDNYLNFVRNETMRALDPIVQKAIKDGKTINFTSVAGARYFLKNVSTDNLLKMKGSKPIYFELLFRKGLRDEQRQNALTSLAKLDDKSELAVLVEAILAQDQQAVPDESVTFDLVRLLTGRTKELGDVRGDLVKLATSGKSPVTRQLGYVALIAADNGIDKAWNLALSSPASLQDLVSAMPLVRDPGQRAALYPKVQPLLKGLPKELNPGTTTGTLVRGRYVRVELPGKLRTLTLAEVEVYSGNQNVARKGKASQINTSNGGVASRAIDGNKSDSYSAGGQTHTVEGTTDPWWEVDLGTEQVINSIVIYNRADGALGSRLNGFTLKVLDQNRKIVFDRRKQKAAPKIAFEVGREAPEVLVRHAAMAALTSVRGQEEATFKELVAFVVPKKDKALDDSDRHAAIQALQRIPARFWPKDEVHPLLDGLLAHVRQIPVKERTSPAALDALQLADSLANTLPLKEARVIRKELGELGVRIIRIGTIPDQMLFDKERIVVKAGRPFEILFENTDLMPHNLVVTQPGALNEVGLMAEAMGTQPGAVEKHYVPATPKILFASNLLMPRDMQRMSLVAPTKPGVYPIVCTYPGHFRRMYAAMYVVEDLDEYQANPEAYLTLNPLPITDELLKLNRPRTEWKYEELAPAVSKMESGRSFVNARQMFQVANCIACHKLNGIGTEVGPDLAKLDAKLKPADILKDILEPSFRINEKFQSFSFELQSGKVITGMILEETPDTVKVIEDPLAKKPALVLKKTDIAERRKLPTSIMPKGQVDRLTHEEILDLVAYVIARGDPRHPVFQGAHQHGGGHKGH